LTFIGLNGIKEPFLDAHHVLIKPQFAGVLAYRVDDLQQGFGRFVLRVISISKKGHFYFKFYSLNRFPRYP
jgi:hypothetical protein